jgi:pimeloyl-ACP methyl ester carboxylesterase
MRMTLVACLILTSAFAQSDLRSGPERIPNAEVFTRTIQSPAGYPLETYITRPKSVAGKLPVIFEAAWLSCDSVQQQKGPEDGFTQLIWDLASHSGYATYRVDKPGVGGSGGPKCGDLDFETELSAYRAAFAAMEQVPFLDTSRVYMIGFSNGGGFAPLVAQNKPVRGYMLFGGWYKTWLEHMLEHERRRMALSGLSPAEMSRRMKMYATFYDEYLNGKKTPAEVIATHPEFKPIWYDEPTRQYGRPASFYQQLQALNLAEAWSRVNVPVLAMHGEYDWIMSADDHKLLVADLNERNPGSAKYIAWPKADHGFYTHATRQKAFGNDPDAKYDPKLSDTVLDWLKQH